MLITDHKKGWSRNYSGPSNGCHKGSVAKRYYVFVIWIERRTEHVPHSLTHSTKSRIRGLKKQKAIANLTMKSKRFHPDAR